MRLQTSSNIIRQDPSVVISSSILSITAIAIKTEGLVMSNSSRFSSIHFVTRMRTDVEQFLMTTCTNLKDKDSWIEFRKLLVYLLPGSVSTSWSMFLIMSSIMRWRLTVSG